MAPPVRDKQRTRPSRSEAYARASERGSLLGLGPQLHPLELLEGEPAQPAAPALELLVTLGGADGEHLLRGGATRCAVAVGGWVGGWGRGR